MDNKVILQKTGLAIVLAGLAFVSLFLSIYHSVSLGIMFSLFPLLLVFFIVCVQSPLITFFLLYVTSFGILGIARYVDLPFPPGLVIDLLLAFNFLVILLHTIWGKNPIGKLYNNPVLTLSLLWMVYCLLEVLNPMTTVANWSTTVRNLGIHIVAFQVLVFFVLNDVKKVRIFFMVWGILVLLATLKALGQKFIGFDAGENAWLASAGGRTHILYSGIRYFSFYTDAANFGCNMGLSMVLFTILGLKEKVRWRRIFYAVVVLLSIYCLMISGTRAAVAVPFVGFTVWVILLKEWKWIISGFIFIGLAFSFFVFTNIGDSNPGIKRMRTAFEFTNDASFNVRLENQKKMRSFMGDYPLGIGMGSAKNAKEGDLMYGLATDSSMVFIWVETGIVGLVFYLLIFATVLVYGVYYVWIKLKSAEIITITIASTAGLAGMLVAGYANEVLHQMPAGNTIYILMGIIMISPYLDKQVCNAHKVS